MPDEAVDHAFVRPPSTLVRPQLLRERERTHGDFKENAKISQATKRLWASSPGWSKLSDGEKESLEQIALKVSRILSGKNLKEHWEDIGGYGILGGESCAE